MGKLVSTLRAVMSMNTIFTHKFINKTKKHALKISLIQAANRFIKSRQLKSGLAALASYYTHRQKAIGRTYDESDTWSQARKRIEILRGNKRTRKSGLRIFWVGANRDQDESGFLQALRRLSNVIEFHNHKGTYGQWFWDEEGSVRVYDPEIVALNDKSLICQIEKTLQDGQIDLLMGQMWANYISKQALARVREFGIPVINVSMDDRLPDNWATQRGTRLGAIGLASATDLVLTTSSETCAWYGVEGCPAVFWPLASDPSIYYEPADSKRDIDVLFIGNKYGIRENIVSDLLKSGIDVSCYGTGWPNGHSSAEKSVELFKRAKIILGIGTIGYCTDVYTVKLRDFDALMTGALYLTHRNPDLLKIFKEGEHFECYAETSECIRKIKYYLKNCEKRTRIANAGYLYASTHFSWESRLKSTLDSLGYSQSE